MNENAAWTNAYMTSSMSYPSEYVIRMFMGEYPDCNFNKSKYNSQRILDIGCGDCRDFPLFKKAGFKEIYGTEITNEIVEKCNSTIGELGIENAVVKVGTNRSLPYEDSLIDYVLSWNVCYYMGEYFDFEAHVKEYARVLAQNGILVFSIPMKTCFIYKGATPTEHEGYVTITNDPFKIRNGIHLRMFSDENDIINTFSPFFKDFHFGSIYDNCFGYDYHWHIGYCMKK